MTSFDSELRELIQKWRDMPGVTREDLLNDLMNAIEALDDEDDDE